MRVLLLQPQVFSPGLTFINTDPRRVNMGLLYIAAYLDRAGHEVNVDLATKGNIQRLMEIYSPEIVGFSVMTPDYPYPKDFFELCKLSLRVYMKRKSINEVFDLYSEKYYKKIEKLCKR